MSILFFIKASQITRLYRNNNGLKISLYTGLTESLVIMNKVYQKPELIDLNEQTGIGEVIDCVGGSGASGCGVGNVARSFCNTGTGGAYT